MNSGYAAAARRRIPNPLKAVDSVWKKAAGPTNMPGQPADPPTGVSYLAGTKPPKRRGAAGYSKGPGRPS